MVYVISVHDMVETNVKFCICILCVIFLKTTYTQYNFAISTSKSHNILVCDWTYKNPACMDIKVGLFSGFQVISYNFSAKVMLLSFNVYI